MFSAAQSTTDLPTDSRANQRGEFGVPQQVLEALEEIFGEPVDQVRVFGESPFARMHGNVLATTRRNRIDLRITGREFVANEELVLHEYFHVIRQWNTGELTRLRYVLESLRRGYWNNRFEVEAREFAEENLVEFREILNP